MNELYMAYHFPSQQYIRLQECKHCFVIILRRGCSHHCINPGSQITQVEARKRCSHDLFTSSGRATALIDRHFWYTFLQQSMTRLTNTAILLTYTSRFHWRFSGNRQEHICEHNIRCFGSQSHLSLGSDRFNVTVCRPCTVPLWDVQRTVRCWSYWKNILGWLALRSSSSPYLYSTVVLVWPFEARRAQWPFDYRKHRQMAESLLTAPQHFIDARPTPQHTHPTLFYYNNFKLSKSPRTPVWISHHTHYKVWGKITYPFLNFKCWSLELDK